MVNTVSHYVEQQVHVHPADGAVDWLQRRAHLSPQRIALIDSATHQQITFAQWNQRANRVANALHGLGLRKGDRVAILAPNSLEYLDLLFACQKTGMILQALNWRLTVSELEVLIRDGDPRLLIYSPNFTSLALALYPRIDVEHWMTLGECAMSSDHRWADWVERAATTPARPTPLTMDDPWILCYTGGTTGLPKGAILTHGTVTWNAINTVMSWGISANTVTALNMPLFHTGGLNVFTTPLVHIGGCSIVCPSFDIEQVYTFIEQRTINAYLGVPTMFIMMQQHPRWATINFEAHQIMISGGASCPTPVFERFFEKNVLFKTGYGLTEAGPNTFWLPDADVRRKMGSVGKPLFHIDVRIMNDEGQECAPDEVGQLLIRGPHVIPGYWNNPQATAETIIDGWLHTGDLARCDEEGYFYIVGRSKDMIISGGENIYPAEVESTMLGHPAVSEVALIGIPDPRWSEVGRAIVVLKAGHHAHERELIAHVTQHLASYKAPKSIIFVSELPKTAAGKVDKKALREQYGGSE